MSSTTYNTPATTVEATPVSDVLALIARLVLAWFFVPAGWGKIAGFSGAVGYAASAGLPLPEVGVAVGLLIELVGGILLLVGFGTRWAALALSLFTGVAAFFFHDYWTLPEAQQMMQQLMFNKNLAISAGLLAFAAFGAGRISIDGRRAAR
jgi:putative oxidoreductase